VGNAGILVTRVLYIKDTPYKRFVVVDAAMNDLIRPALYGAYHKIIPVVHGSQSTVHRDKLVDIVGPVCESGDFLGKDRYLDVAEEECLVVLGCGAYSFSMSSNYNSRPRAAEVLVDGNKVYLARRRETYKDLIAKEVGLV
jgi:diaminopimelate decarboxylase